MATINEAQIRQWFDIFHAGQDLTEVRVLGKGRMKNLSGYFVDVESVIAALVSAPEGCGIYSPINQINTACWGRSQQGQLVEAKTTTSDNDIVGRRWILIDLDPRRPADTNSTDAEKAAAYKVATRIAKFLRDQGFKSPVYADSANGFHLYYRVELANTDTIALLVSKFLQVLEMLFGNDSVDIDISVFNASRIAKIIGTMSNKGISTEDRPQRMSYFVKVPPSIEPTDIAYIRKVAAMFPEREKPSRENGYRTESFDLRDFIQRHNIAIEREAGFKGGTKFVLKECPFDSNHKAPDSALFQTSDGAIGFKCFHNSCSGKTWRDFRLLFEPDAYNRSYSPRQREYEKKIEPPKIQAETQEIGKKWLRMNDIKWRNPADIVHIKTGITKIDEKFGGLALGELTIISGLNASGKTSLLDHIILSARTQGFKTLVWSGEMQDWRFMNWLDLMAAGPNFVTKREGYDNLYYTTADVTRRINSWLGEYVMLYNNNYGSKYSQLFSDVKEEVEKTGAKLILLDNLMTIAIDNIVGDKNDRQSSLIQEIKDYAKAKDVSIILVCHPRKEQGFLRKESIAGTADLSNAADNVFIIHRVGNDFFRRGEEFFGNGKLDEFDQCGNVIEVAKHRETGLADFLVGLYYDIPSKRFKNDVAEHIVYGWQPDDLPDEPMYVNRENPPVAPSVHESSKAENETYAEPSSFALPLPDNTNEIEDMPDFENRDIDQLPF